jgi:exosome complex exonuclease DIS3/RRP44
MDKEKNPKEVNYYPTFETNSMIEEFMLLGNVSVGEKILNNFPSVAVLRNHPPPKAD